MNPKQIKIMDTTFREAHQSLLAARMRLDDLLPIAEKMDSVGFWSLEVWGGATFDACLRYLGEDPWQRLREIKKLVKKTPLQMLLRGQNLVGYRNYPDDVVERFVDKTIENGINIARIFDPLNDLRNLKTAVKATLKYGGKVEVAFCYTRGPIYSNDFFIELAARIEDMGADTICIKDMAGILSPLDAYDLVTKIKEKVSVPIHLNTHDTSGMGVATYLKAIEAGLDILDASISSMASGTSQPALEVLCNILRDTAYDPAFDFKLMAEIANYFKEVRKKYKAFESEYTSMDPNALIYQIPGGMLSNLAHQLNQQGALDKIEDVLNEVPRVREDFGYPPLITPLSQIICTQATLNIITGERYKIITSETKNYMKGLYGKTPAPVNEDIRKKILKDEQPITARPADILSPEMEMAKNEIGDKAASEEDVLSYALFPQLFLNYLEQKEKGLPPERIEVLEKVKKPLEQIIEPVPHLAPSEFIISVHGESYNIKVAGAGHKTEAKRPYFLYVDDHMVEVLVEPLAEVLPSEFGKVEAKATKRSTRPQAVEIGDITTGMPGRIVKILVKKGDTVKAGDTIMVIEAMKMENEIHSTIDGKVTEIFVSIGDAVNPDEVLAQIR
jgi:pyruvate carboxylase subunit B